MTDQNKEARIRSLAVNKVDLTERIDKLKAELRSATEHARKQELAADIASAELAYTEASREYDEILHPGARERWLRSRF